MAGLTDPDTAVPMRRIPDMIDTDMTEQQGQNIQKQRIRNAIIRKIGIQRG